MAPACRLPPPQIRSRNSRRPAWYRWAIATCGPARPTGACLRKRLRRSSGFDDYNVIVNNPAIANNLGYAYQQAGRYAEAKLAYRQAIELDPDYWKARINLDALESARSR
jgi:tetratricopeptide (TPR) repeat protein